MYLYDTAITICADTDTTSKKRDIFNFIDRLRFKKKKRGKTTRRYQSISRSFEILLVYLFCFAVRVLKLLCIKKIKKWYICIHFGRKEKWIYYMSLVPECTLSAVTFYWLLFYLKPVCTATKSRKMAVETSTFWIVGFSRIKTSQTVVFLPPSGWTRLSSRQQVTFVRVSNSRHSSDTWSAQC